METYRFSNRVVVFMTAAVLVMSNAAVRAGHGRDDNDHRRVEVTFTKWILSAGPNPLFMRGVTGGDIEGVFVGEIFVSMAKTNPDIPAVTNLEVIYGVQADEPNHSFTALLRGGAALGKAQLDGRILAGWRIGTPVHVEWVRFPSPSVDCPSPPAGAGPFCFVGAIAIDRVEHDDDDHRD
jgi:hypothetical protein